MILRVLVEGEVAFSRVLRVSVDRESLLCFKGKGEKVVVLGIGIEGKAPFSSC